MRWERASPRPLRPEAQSVSRQGRELSLNRVRQRVPECPGRRPRSHQLVTQQSGLAWLGFLMIAAAMAGISVFV